MQDKWRNKGHHFDRFEQGVDMALPQQNGQTVGICRTMVQQWVKYRKDGLGASLAMMPFKERPIWEAVSTRHLDANARRGGATSLEFPGLTRASTRSRIHGFLNLGQRQLHSRDAILGEMFMTRGLYMLGLHRASRAGHGLGFDTRGATSLYFMDPNTGQYQTTWYDEELFRRWYKEYYACTGVPPAGSYKTYYHDGSRTLTRYE